LLALLTGINRSPPFGVFDPFDDGVVEFEEEAVGMKKNYKNTII
jgi:hypothetical protein